MTQADNSEDIQEGKGAQPETQSGEREEVTQETDDSGKDASQSSDNEDADQAKSSREATLDALASLGRSNEKKSMSNRNKTTAIVVCAIVVAIVVVLVLLATHVICFHDEVTEATCTEPPTCMTCNRAQGEALGHAWADATCTEPKTCSVCSATEGEALGHEWIAATKEKPKTCSVCNKTEGYPLGRKAITSLSDAPSVIKNCFDTIPNCTLNLKSESSNSYSIYSGSTLVGIMGVELDEFDVVALIDKRKSDPQKSFEQISLAIILANNPVMNYSEAKKLWDSLDEKDTITREGVFYSKGIQSGMYAFGVDILWL